MSHADLTGGLKTNREERLTKHVGFVYANAQKAKNKKINDEKCGVIINTTAKANDTTDILQTFR